MKPKIFNILAMILCAVLLWAQTPMARQIWLDWNHQFRWAVMGKIFYQWVLPCALVLFLLLFLIARREYQIQWIVAMFLVVVFPSIISQWQQGQLFIDLPELLLALILVVTGLFCQLARWRPRLIIAIGVISELIELVYPHARFFELKDVVINLFSIGAGYYLLKRTMPSARSATEFLLKNGVDSSKIKYPENEQMGIFKTATLIITLIGSVYWNLWKWCLDTATNKGQDAIYEILSSFGLRSPRTALMYLEWIGVFVCLFFLVLSISVAMQTQKKQRFLSKVFVWSIPIIIFIGLMFCFILLLWIQPCKDFAV